MRPFAICLLALVVATLAACGEDGPNNARHVLSADAQLECLALWDHDRLCEGSAAVAERDVVCPQEAPGELYDTYGGDCVRAQTALWSCQADLDCSAVEGCEAEIVARSTACSVTAGDAG